MRLFEDLKDFVGIVDIIGYQGGVNPDRRSGGDDKCQRQPVITVIDLDDLSSLSLYQKRFGYFLKPHQSRNGLVDITYSQDAVFALAGGFLDS